MGRVGEQDAQRSIPENGKGGHFGRILPDLNVCSDWLLSSAFSPLFRLHLPHPNKAEIEFLDNNQCMQIYLEPLLTCIQYATHVKKGRALIIQ